ncbi:MAG: sulfurtransferase [Sarcina sp.]
MNNKVQKATVAIVAIVVFLATFFGSTREQVVVEAKKIVTDSNNINNDYLIGIQSLENALGAKGLVILDIRSSKEYDKGHIPGAINVSWSQFIDKNTQSDNTQSNNAQSNNAQSNNTQSDNMQSNNAQSNNAQSDNTQSNNAQNNNDNISNDTTNWTNLINKKVLTNELQSLGINKDSTVVIYGDSNGDDLGELGKFSWMFRMVGLQSKMLNGGYKNWKSQGFKTTTVVPSIIKSDMEIKSFTPIKAIKTDDLEKNISKIKILELVNDVKENQENLTNTANTANNENNTKNTKNTKNNNEQKIANKIDNNVQLKTNEQDTEVDPPVEGVIQIKLSDMLNPNGTIKPVSQLQQLFNSKGISKDDVLLFYNTDKGNLAFLTLMLNMSGYTNIETYNASLTQVAQITTQILNTKNENENDKNSTQGKSAKVNNISTQGNTSNNIQNNNSNNNSNSNSSNNANASGNGNSTNINSSNQNTNN